MSIRMKIITATVATALGSLLLAGVAGAYTGIPAGTILTKTLQSGSVDQEVVYLKIILADEGCLTGVTNTTLFGPKTKAGVQCFQAKYGTGTLGTVGPNTRAKLNVLLAATPPPTAGCPAGAIYNSITGALCVVTPPPTAGCPAGAIYNSITGALCVVTPTPGVIGFISVATLAAAPADNANIITTSNVPVYGINVKAINSNMDVNSAKIVLYITKSGSVEHPATSMTNLYVYDGSTLLGTFPVNTSTVIKESSTYYMILSGFHFNVPANTTKVLTFSADFVAGLETDRILEIAMYDTTAIGATDGTGVNRTSGLTPTITSGNPSTNQRTHTINYDVVGTSTVVVTTNATDLVSTSINVNHTDGKTDVPMFIFSAKSTVGASVITDLVFTATGSDAGVAKVSSVKLYDGSTLLGSKSLSSAVSGATATFADLVINVAKDATKTLTVKADIAADVTSNGDDYVRLSIANPSSNVTYDKPNLAAAHPTSATAVNGNYMYLYDNVVTTFALVSTASSYAADAVTTSTGYTNGVITLRVHSDGGTTTEPVTGDFTVVAYNGGTAIVAVPTQVITVTPDSTISDGNDATVVINLSESIGITGAGFIDFRITNIKWAVTDGTYTSTETAQTWGLSTFKTPIASAQ